MSITGSSVVLGNVRATLTANRYVEGIVRGYRNNLLTAANYGNLTQCDTIDGRCVSTSYEESVLIA